MKGKCCRLVIKKDKKFKIVMVEGATMMPIDFTDTEKLKRIYYQVLEN